MAIPFAAFQLTLDDLCKVTAVVDTGQGIMNHLFLEFVLQTEPVKRFVSVAKYLFKCRVQTVKVSIHAGYTNKIV